MSNIWDRERLLRSTVLAGFAASGLAFAPAVAQDAVQTPSQEDCQPGEVLVDGVCELDSTEERIVVTGSRIARDEFSSASPIQVIDGEIARANVQAALDRSLAPSLEFGFWRCFDGCS